jgi:predicted Zn-dependent peptidase
MSLARRVPRWLAGAAVGAVCLLAGSGAWCEQTGDSHRAVLDNGLEVLFRPNPSALTLAVCCFVKVSALIETRDTAGLRNLTLQVLLDLSDEGGHTLRQRLDDLGMQGDVQITPDYCEVTLLGTADQLPPALGFVREILTNSRLDPKLFRLRQTQAVQEVAERRDTVSSVAVDMATGYLYRGTACAWPLVGTSRVSAFELRQVQALRAMRFVPANTTVAISGNLTLDECLLASRESLGSLLPRPAPAEPAAAPNPRTAGAYLYSPWEGESAVVLGAARSLPPASAEFPADALANAVLGLGQGSRLFQLLRRERGLVYQVSADFVPSQLCPTLALTASCEPNQAAEVFRLMRGEVAALKSRPPTAGEIQHVATLLNGSFWLGHQRNAEAAHYLGVFDLLFAGLGHPDLASRLLAVTPEQVARQAATLADRMVWVQVGGERAQ